MLPNYEGAVLNKLGMGSFFGNPAEEDQLDINMQRSFTSWWESHGMDMNEHKPNLEWHKIVTKGPDQLKKAKAATCKMLLGWVVALISNQNGATLLNDMSGGNLGDCVLQVGSDLVKFYERCASQPWKMSNQALNQLDQLSETITKGWAETPYSVTMKWHILGHHLVDQMRFAGNCKWSHNYLDETENYHTRVIGASVSRVRHADMFLGKWMLKNILSRISRQSS